MNFLLDRTFIRFFLLTFLKLLAFVKSGLLLLHLNVFTVQHNETLLCEEPCFSSAENSTEEEEEEDEEKGRQGRVGVKRKKRGGVGGKKRRGRGRGKGEEGKSGGNKRGEREWREEEEGGEMEGRGGSLGFRDAHTGLVGETASNS